MYSYYDNLAYEEDPYPNLRGMLAADYQDAAPEEIEAIVGEALGGAVGAEDLEAFPLIPLLAAAVPALIQAAPSVIQAVSSLGSRPAPAQPRPAAPPSPRPAAAPPPRPATPFLPRPRPAPRLAVPITPAIPAPSVGGAAGEPNAPLQLLATLTALLPQVVQAVGAMAMGPYGQESVEVGGQPVPVESFAQMVGVLSEQAVEQYQARRHAWLESAEYLPDQDNDNVADPADPEASAQALFGLLTNEVAEAVFQEVEVGYETPDYEAYAGLYEGWEDW